MYIVERLIDILVIGWISIVCIWASTLLANDDEIGDTPGCKRSDYVEANSSDYILPFSVNEEYLVEQGNCDVYSHKSSFINYEYDAGDLRYAYDFALPVGTKVIAARGGKVINVVERNRDYIVDLFRSNFIIIQHADNSVARYSHLTQDGALVDIDDEVQQGDVIGISGSSGTGFPHLHFDVAEKDSITCTWSFETINANGGEFIEHGCKTIPITFKNADPLDIPLRRGKTYKALAE